MAHPRPRLFTFPCGLHRGPKPVPLACPMCERARQEEAERPPVPGYGVGRMDATRRRNQQKWGAQAGQHRTPHNAVKFPQKKQRMTGSELLDSLRKAGKPKDKP